jgi:macrolide-specific efflux system membrane fusion protein
MASTDALSNPTQSKTFPPRLAFVVVVWTTLFWNSSISSNQPPRLDVQSVIVRLIDQVDVPAQSLGVLSEIKIQEGDRVKAKQILGELDPQEAQLLLDQAVAQQAIAAQQAIDDVAVRAAKLSVAYATDEHARLAKANQEQPRSVSESELAKSKQAMEQALLDLEKQENEIKLKKLQSDRTKSELAIAQRNLALRSVTAPLTGVVVSVLRSPGDWVKPGDKLFRIVSIDRLRAEGFAQSTSIDVNAQGAKAQFVADQESTASAIQGTVVFVSTEVDPVNGQVRVWVDLDNRLGKLKPGMRGSLKIQWPAN